MTPRPLHRWKTFWFGLIILTFLGWGWVRSVTHVSSLSYKASYPSAAWGFGNFAGSIGIYWDKDPFEGPGFRASSTFLPPNQRPGIVFPTAIFVDLPDTRWEGGQFAIAHWFVILLLLIPWAVSLIRRHRRLKRLHPSLELDREG